MEYRTRLKQIIYSLGGVFVIAACAESVSGIRAPHSSFAVSSASSTAQVEGVRDEVAKTLKAWEASLDSYLDVTNPKMDRNAIKMVLADTQRKLVERNLLETDDLVHLVPALAQGLMAAVGDAPRDTHSSPVEAAPFSGLPAVESSLSNVKP